MKADDKAMLKATVLGRARVVAEDLQVRPAADRHLYVCGPQGDAVPKSRQQVMMEQLAAIRIHISQSSIERKF